MLFCIEKVNFFRLLFKTLTFQNKPDDYCLSAFAYESVGAVSPDTWDSAWNLKKKFFLVLETGMFRAHERANCTLLDNIPAWQLLSLISFSSFKTWPLQISKIPFLSVGSSLCFQKGAERKYRKPSFTSTSFSPPRRLTFVILFIGFQKRVSLCIALNVLEL